MTDLGYRTSDLPPASAAALSSAARLPVAVPAAGGGYSSVALEIGQLIERTARSGILPRVVDTLAGLRSAPPEAGTAVVRGARQPGDGGGGQFRWAPGSEAPDDGAMVIAVSGPAATAGRWVRDHDQVADPAWWGASGDGQADDTAAVQAALGSGLPAVRLPPGKRFAMFRRLTVAAPLLLFGGGELHWLAGVANGPAIEIKADGVTINNIHLRNPQKLGSKTGAASFGIFFAANEGSVTGCVMRHWQTGIGVSAYGEYTKFVFSNNQILDCISSGDGPADTDSDRGEDRGDGIVVWGAICSITGNVITAEAGADCRIGIHVEALDPYMEDPGQYPAALASVAGNTVVGPFRRGIVFEGVRNGSITGNTVAGATWWGIALAATVGCTVTANPIRYDRPADNQAGKAWDPKYAAIMMINGCVGSVVANNPIVVTGRADAGIYVQSLPDLRGRGNQISGNNIKIENRAGPITGIYVQYEDGISIGQNDIHDATAHGIYFFASSGIKASDNRVRGLNIGGVQNRHGIHVEGGTVVNCINDVHGFDVGLYAVNAEGGLIATNYVSNCGIAGDFFGSNLAVRNNEAITCPQGWLHLPATASGNNLG